MTGAVGLLLLFFRVGLFSFGGGYAMLPLIFQGIQSVGRFTAAEFSRLVALSQITPGPIAINAATYVGYKFGGLAGAAAATLGVVLPSVLLVLLVAHFLARFQQSHALTGILSGIRPAALGLLGSAVVFLAQGSLVVDGRLVPMSVAIAAIVLALAFWKKIHPITLTVAAGIAGAFLIR